MALRKRTLLPIGIHLNLEYIHMVQLEQADGGLQLVSVASRYFGPPPESDEKQPPAARKAAMEERWQDQFGRAKQFIRNTVSSNGFRGNRVVISLPAEHVVIQHVRVTPMQPEELITALPWELQGKLPFDPRAAVIRHIVVGVVSENNETKQDVIALAARRQTVEKYAAGVEKLGLQVAGVGIESCAMCYPYAFAAMHAAPSQEGPASLMLVHLANHTTHVAIVRGQDTTFVKDVELGTEHLARALARANKISFEEARELRTRWRGATDDNRAAATDEAVQHYNAIRPDLEPFVDELESCMRYHASVARGAQIGRILFLGPEARDRGLVRVLGAQMGASSDVGDPVGTATGTQGAVQPELAVATGLSLFGAQ